MSRALRNFVRGAGSILDLLPTRGPATISSGGLDRSPEEAMQSDLAAVGRDFWSVLHHPAFEDRDHAEAGEEEGRTGTPAGPGRGPAAD